MRANSQSIEALIACQILGFHFPHANTGITTTPFGPICPACGIIKKSDRASCCGHGGSWFGKCGSAGNANLRHTWYEGIQVCATQYQAAMAQKLHAVQPKSNVSSGDGSIDTDFRATVVRPYMFASTSANTSVSIPGAIPVTTASTSIMHSSVNASKIKMIVPPADRVMPQVNQTILEPMRGAVVSMSMAKSSHTSASAAANEREYEKLFRVAVYMSVIFIIVS